MNYDINEIRKQFPILSRTINGKPLVYLDNAATTQIPETVLNVISEQYRLYEANVHRGIHYLSEKSTARMEGARESARRFINAYCAEEIIFSSGTSDSINIIAQSFFDAFLHPGDEIITTEMEHHSNFVPWQELCRRRGITLRVVPLDERGELRLDVLDSFLSKKVKLMAVCAVSNVLGTVNPLENIIKKVHAVGGKVLVDGAQSLRHGKIDVRGMDCDFFVFSGHKIMGPTGTGIIYGKRELLEKMPPVRFGGGMVDIVTKESTSFNELPFKFEAGTPNIAGNIALGAALDYFSGLADFAISYEASLLRYTEERLGELGCVDILGSPSERSGVLSFNLHGAHHFDTAALLDKLGIAVRSGHHCAQPLLRAFGLSGVVRISPAFYNTYEEIDSFINGLIRINKLIGGIKKNDD